MKTQRQRSAALLATCLLFSVAACGGTGAFGLNADDNNPQRLAEAFALRQAPAPDATINVAGTPMVFMAVSGKPKKLVAFDLASSKEVWRVDSDVASRVVVGKNFVANFEANGKLVGRDLATGKVKWTHGISADAFLGAAADRERVYYVSVEKGKKPTWWLVALDGQSGDEIWRADAPGQLGIPAAQGGLVYSPFLNQWMGILDAKTGKQVTRIRGVDEEISFVRTTSNHVYFGSNSGVFLLDERAASGKRAESTYGTAQLPAEFVRSHYFWDAFDRVQAGYSAFDRNRILWRGEAKDGKLDLGAHIVVHTFRFFFGFSSADGSLAWAYNHPRTDVVASDHVGKVIGFVSGQGEIGALDPESGARVFAGKIDAGGSVLGATFDADGWAPTGQGVEGEPDSTVAALASIARDRDARFNDVKKFAVAALATLPGGDVARDLLAIIQDERTTPALHDAAVEALVARKDTAGVAHLVAAIKVSYDFITGSQPRAVGPVARALAAMEAAKIEAAVRGEAVGALLNLLHAPETKTADLVHVIRALGAVGAGEELAPLRAFLLVYRSDPAFSTQVDAVGATIDVLLVNGAGAERELVSYVAEDPRTQPGIAEYASRALEQTATQPQAPQE